MTAPFRIRNTAVARRSSGLFLFTAVLIGCFALALDIGGAATFTVTTTNDTGAGSLRAAIASANGTGGGTNLIQFAVTNPPAGVRTITPATALPAITRPVIIDGYTQPGSSSNTLANGEDAVLLIEISGAIVRGDIGLFLSGVGGSTLRGLVIDNGWSRGVLIQTTNVVVEGCFIGTDPTGLVARPVGIGVFADSGLDTSSSRIGGTLPGQRNVILGSNPCIFFQSGTNHLVQGNFIGTDATGTNSLASGIGITFQFSSGNLVGGTNTAARNVIIGGDGIQVSSSSTGNRIQGNFIGIDVTGSKVLGSFGSFGTGISVDSSSATQIGGVTSTRGAPPGNVIRAGTGIYLASGSSGTVIQGNLIGTDATGFKPLGSGLDGIELYSSFNVVSNNVIAANSRRGILITESHDNLVQDNFIGTDITGTNFLGNAAEGVLAYGCFSNTIRANVIAGNQGAGVNLYAPFGVVSNISVLGNSIFANGGLGIALVAGANNSQTNPVLTNVLSGSNAVVIQGFLASVPNTTYRVEFFANTGCDPSGFGEGETFLGATNLATDATGTNTFTATLPPLGICRFIATATATDPNGNTSEFSPCLQSVGVDSDGDGECDVEEILAGTDPHNSGSVFRISQFKREDNNVRVTWTCGAGRTNMLQAAPGGPDGSLTNNFVDLPPPIILSGVGVVMTNRLDLGAATNTPARYYRVRLVR